MAQMRKEEQRNRSGPITILATLTALTIYSPYYDLALTLNASQASLRAMDSK